MKAIGIDPGYDRMGVAVLERIEGTDTLLYSVCVLTDKKSSFSERLVVIGRELTTILTEHEPHLLGIETLFFNNWLKNNNKNI